MSAEFLEWLDTTGAGNEDISGAARSAFGMGSQGAQPSSQSPPPSMPLSTPHDTGGEGMGAQFLKMLPLLAAGGAAAFAAHKSGGLSGGDAIAHMTSGFLKDRLDTALTKKRDQNAMDEFLTKAAYEKVDSLNGKDLAGIKVPDGLKNRLIELHKKANEARMNDGVVTPKEAQEILALAGPIEAELQSLKTDQSSPEAMARDKEKALQAGYNTRDEALGNEPGSTYRSESEALQKIGVPNRPELGLMPKKDAAGIIQKDAQNAIAKRKVDDAFTRMLNTDARAKDRIALALHSTDARTLNSSLESMKRRAYAGALQSAAVAQVPVNSEAFDSFLDAAIHDVMNMGDSVGQPAYVGNHTPKPSGGGARKVVRGPDGKLTLGQ